MIRKNKSEQRLNVTIFKVFNVSTAWVNRPSHNFFNVHLIDEGGSFEVMEMTQP